MPVSHQGTTHWPSQINCKYWWTLRLWFLHQRTTKSKFIHLKRDPQTTWDRGVPRDYPCIPQKIAFMKMFNLVLPILSRLSTTHPYLIRANISAPVASIVLRMNITQKVSLTMRKTTMRKYPKRSVYRTVNTTKISSRYLREPMLWRMHKLRKDYFKEMLSQIRISRGWFESMNLYNVLRSVW